VGNVEQNRYVVNKSELVQNGGLMMSQNNPNQVSEEIKGKDKTRVKRA
jgi:hypothetical protein